MMIFYWLKIIFRFIQFFRTYTTTYTHPVAYGLHHPYGLHPFGLGFPLAVAPAAAEAEEPAAEGAVVDA